MKGGGGKALILLSPFPIPVLGHLGRCHLAKGSNSALQAICESKKWGQFPEDFGVRTTRSVVLGYVRATSRSTMEMPEIWW